MDRHLSALESWSSGAKTTRMAQMILIKLRYLRTNSTTLRRTRMTMANHSEWLSLHRVCWQMLQSSHILHADATYKLNWEGMPVLIIGTTDLNRSFHLISICISSDESKASFRFIFNSLLNQMLQSTPNIWCQTPQTPSVNLLQRHLVQKAFWSCVGPMCSITSTASSIFSLMLSVIKWFPTSRTCTQHANV